MLYNKYQPRVWADIVGQDKAVKVAKRAIERDGFDRGAFWIECSGANNSGVGKSSLANVIANELAGDFFIIHLSGADCDKKAVKKIEQDGSLTTWCDKPYRVWIIDEAHAISSGAIDAFLTLLEHLPKHCVIIFTTTRKADEGLFGSDCGAFASRVLPLKLTNQGLAKPFAKRVQEIAKAENLDGRPIKEYIKLIQDCKNNMRLALQRVYAGEMIED